jgi:hypothetical protein
MRFKVNLQKSNTGTENHLKPDVGNFLRDIKIKFDVCYWGLSPALEHQSLSRVSLNGTTQVEKTKFANYEVDLFSERLYDTFGFMRSRFAAAGLSLAAVVAFLGAGSTDANAVTQDTSSINQAAGEAIKAQNAVIPNGGNYRALDTYKQEGFERAPYNLAYWHNNTGTHSNNHNNVESHSNAAWVNRSSAHSNQWSNTPHSNLPPISHTNVSGGSVPNEYLY